MRIKMKRSRDGPDLWVPVCSTEREAMELELEEITRIWCREVKSFVKGKESQPDGQQTASNLGYVNNKKKNKQTLPRQDGSLEDRGGKEGQEKRQTWGGHAVTYRLLPSRGHPTAASVLQPAISERSSSPGQGLLGRQQH